MNPKEKEESKKKSERSRAREVAAMKHAPAKLGLMRENLRSTAAGVMDKSTGEWILRLDGAHNNAPTAHININSKFTGVKDPHTPIPQGFLTAGKNLTKVVEVVGKAALIVSLAQDSYRIVDAIVDDCNNSKKKKPGKKTVKVGSSVAGGWAGGLLGAWAGNASGASIGAAVGALFGGVGAAPGAIIGSFIGTIAGGVKGGTKGSSFAENIVDELYQDSEEEEEDDDDEKRN